MATSGVSEKQGGVRRQEGLLYGRILPGEKEEWEEEEEEAFCHQNSYRGERAGEGAQQQEVTSGVKPSH